MKGGWEYAGGIGCGTVGGAAPLGFWGVGAQAEV